MVIRPVSAKRQSNKMARLGYTAVAFGVSFLIGCVAQPIDEQTAAEIEKVGRDPNRLLVVDCLLPGQVRQLGTRLTYMTPRRPVKASAAECELRGGEYVAYDRSNFATSLKIWLPKAQKGDPEAQTYVGEIYEKGLGTQADYGLAAEWYRRAAEQGYSRAQINLGYLLESGLGVEVDLTEAMNWYRRASGISDGELEYVSSAENVRREKAAEELVSLRERVVALQAELDSRQAELAEQRASVESLRQSVAERRAEAVAAAKKISQLQSDKQDALAIPGRALAEIETLKNQLETARNEQQRLTDQLADQQQATVAARKQFASANQELSERAAELADTNRQLTQAREGIAAAGTDGAQRSKLEAEIKRLNSQVQSQQSDMDKLRQRQSASSAEYEAQLAAAEQTELQLKQSLDQSNSEVNQLQTRLTSERDNYQNDIKSLQTRLGDAESERKLALAETAKLRGEIGTLKGELDSAIADERELRRQLTAQRLDTAEAEQQFEQANKLLADRTAELDRTASSLSNARLELASAADSDTDTRNVLQADIDRLTAQLDKQSRETDTLRSQQTAQSARFEAALAGARNAERQLEESLLARQQQAESLQVQLDHQRNQFSNTVTDLQAQLSVAQQGSAQLLAEIDDLKIQLASASSDQLRLSRQLEERERDTARAQRQLLAVNQTLGAKTQAYQELQQQLQTARDTLQGAAAGSADQQQQLRATISKLEALSDSRQSQLAQLRSQQSAESAQLEAQLADAQRAELQSRQQLAARDRQLEQLQSELGSQRDRYEQSVAQLEQSLAASEGQTQQLQRTVEQLQDERGKLSNSLAQAQKVRERAAAEQRRLTDQLTRAQLDAGADRAELARLRSRATRAERSLVTAQQEQLRVQDRLLDVELAMAEKQSSSEADTARLENVIAEREQTVEAQAAEIERLLAEVSGAREALASASGGADLEQIQAQLAERESALDYARNEQERLTDKLVDVQLAAAASNTESAARLAELEARLASSEAALALKESEVEALEGQVTQAESQAGQNNADKVANVVALGPSIEIIEPPQYITRGLPTLPWQSRGDRMDIIGRVDPIGDVLSLKINGQLQDLNDAGVFQYSHSKGDDRALTIVAVTRNGERNQVDFNFAVPSNPLAATPVVAEAGNRKITPKELPGVNFGNYYALIIGNNEYPQLTNLRSAENDARVIDRILRTKYGFKTELLLNADKITMLTALNNMRQTLTSRDNLLIYYAGHGELDRSNNRGYWLPVDASADENSNWVSNKSITDIIDSMKAKHILAVVDSCYSGTLTRTAVPRLQQQLSVELTERWYKVVSASRVRAVLSSGGVKPVYDSLGESEHSLFAQAFIDELEKNNGILEAYDLYTNVQRRVSVEAQQYNVEQSPQYAPIKHAGHEAGEFFFLPGKVAGLDLLDTYHLPVAMATDHLWRQVY